MKFSWIIASAVLLWSNFGRVHAQPIMSDSMPTPSASMSSMADPTMEAVFDGEREPSGMISDKKSATVQTAHAFTAERSDEAQPTTSLLSVEASGVAEPSMSIAIPISMSMSMRSEKQLRVGIITGGLAGGITVLTFASMIAVLCHRILQKRRNGQGNRYGTKDRGVDIDDYDIEDQQDTIDSSQEPRQSAPSQQYQAGNHIPRRSSQIDDAQSFDVPPSYAMATLRQSLGQRSLFRDNESTITRLSSSTFAPPAYCGPPGYGDVVLSAI